MKLICRAITSFAIPLMLFPLLSCARSEDRLSEFMAVCGERLEISPSDVVLVPVLEGTVKVPAGTLTNVHGLPAARSEVRTTRGGCAVAPKESGAAVTFQSKLLGKPIGAARSIEGLSPGIQFVELMPVKDSDALRDCGDIVAPKSDFLPVTLPRGERPAASSLIAESYMPSTGTWRKNPQVVSPLGCVRRKGADLVLIRTRAAISGVPEHSALLDPTIGTPDALVLELDLVAEVVKECRAAPPKLLRARLTADGVRLLILNDRVTLRRDESTEKSSDGEQVSLCRGSLPCARGWLTLSNDRLSASGEHPRFGRCIVTNRTDVGHVRWSGAHGERVAAFNAGSTKAPNVAFTRLTPTPIRSARETASGLSVLFPNCIVTQEGNRIAFTSGFRVPLKIVALDAKRQSLLRSVPLNLSLRGESDARSIPITWQGNENDAEIVVPEMRSERYAAAIEIPDPLGGETVTVSIPTCIAIRTPLLPFVDIARVPSLPPVIDAGSALRLETILGFKFPTDAAAAYAFATPMGTADVSIAEPRFHPSQTACLALGGTRADSGFVAFPAAGQFALRVTVCSASGEEKAFTFGDVRVDGAPPTFRLDFEFSERSSLEEARIDALFEPIELNVSSLRDDVDPYFVLRDQMKVSIQLVTPGGALDLPTRWSIAAENAREASLRVRANWSLPLDTAWSDWAPRFREGKLRAVVRVATGDMRKSFLEKHLDYRIAKDLLGGWEPVENGNRNSSSKIFDHGTLAVGSALDGNHLFLSGHFKLLKADPWTLTEVAAPHSSYPGVREYRMPFGNDVPGVFAVSGAGDPSTGRSFDDSVGAVAEVKPGLFILADNTFCPTCWSMLDAAPIQEDLHRSRPLATSGPNPWFRSVCDEKGCNALRDLTTSSGISNFTMGRNGWIARDADKFIVGRHGSTLRNSFTVPAQDPNGNMNSVTTDAPETLPFLNSVLILDRHDQIWLDDGVQPSWDDYSAPEIYNLAEGTYVSAMETYPSVFRADERVIVALDERTGEHGGQAVAVSRDRICSLAAPGNANCVAAPRALDVENGARIYDDTLIVRPVNDIDDGVLRLLMIRISSGALVASLGFAPGCGEPWLLFANSKAYMSTTASCAPGEKGRSHPFGLVDLANGRITYPGAPFVSGRPAFPYWADDSGRTIALPEASSPLVETAKEPARQYTSPLEISDLDPFGFEPRLGFTSLGAGIILTSSEADAPVASLKGIVARCTDPFQSQYPVTAIASCLMDLERAGIGDRALPAVARKLLPWNEKITLARSAHSGRLLAAWFSLAEKGTYFVDAKGRSIFIPEAAARADFATPARLDDAIPGSLQEISGRFFVTRRNEDGPHSYTEVEHNDAIGFAPKSVRSLRLKFDSESTVQTVRLTYIGLEPVSVEFPAKLDFIDPEVWMEHAGGHLRIVSKLGVERKHFIEARLPLKDGLLPVPSAEPLFVEAQVHDFSCEDDTSSWTLFVCSSDFPSRSAFSLDGVFTLAPWTNLLAGPLALRRR